MECKKGLLTAILAAVFGYSGLQAQNSLFVSETSGNQTSIPLPDIRKLTFAAGNLSVYKTDGNADSYDLIGVRCIRFKDFITEVVPAAGKESSYTTIYPNPVSGQLQILYESSGTGNVEVTIMDLLGKVLIRQNIISQCGMNHAIINVELLSCGLYICLIHDGNKAEISKFFKNE